MVASSAGHALLPSLPNALGAVLGALVGDAAGATLEFFRRPITDDDVAHALTMPGGGTWQIAPGQITDDGELTMSLLRALVRAPDDPTRSAAEHYARWVASDPFDIGVTTSRSLGCTRDPSYATIAREVGLVAAMTHAARARCMPSKANGSLMRATPLAVWGARRSAEATREVTTADAELSHPNPACVAAAAVYVGAIRHLILGPEDLTGAIDVAKREAAVMGDPEVIAWLDEALAGVVVPYTPQDGFVRIGFTHAFRHLAAGTSYEAALRETLSGGGDTDTNACIVGGLLGARFGVTAIPSAMRDAVVGCDTARAKHPRPADLHPREVSTLVDELIGPARDAARPGGVSRGDERAASG